MGPRYIEPRYNEDPVITNNIWKPGRIAVKYGETNPAITKPRYNEIRVITNWFGRSQWTIHPDNEYFVLSPAVGKNDMMIQMVDKPNTTRVG